MNYSTLKLYNLLVENGNSSVIVLELLKLHRKQMVSETLVKYILSKKQISFDFYQNVYYGVNLYHQYEEKDSILINC